MKKIITVLASLFITASLTFTVQAQSKATKKVNNTLNKVNSTKTSVEEAGSTISSTIETFNATKNLVKGVVGPKKKGGQEQQAVTVSPLVTITIKNIDVDDEKLEALNNQLSKAKGVTSTGMNYDAGNAKLKIGYTGTSLELWKSLPKEAKTAFKITKIDDSSIDVQYKNAMVNASAGQ